RSTIPNGSAGARAWRTCLARLPTRGRRGIDVDSIAEIRMSLRVVVREIREFPATAIFSASWIILFGMMVVGRLGDARLSTLWRVRALGIGEAHRFGDLTLRDLSNGEYWRLATCNFVHYSVLHIGLNLFAFYLLGTLLESWYGSWRLVAIYGATG